MRKIGLLFVFLIVFAGLGLFVYLESTNIEGIDSPLPDSLNKNNNSQVSSLDFWLPAVLGFFTGDGDELQLSAKSVLVYDLKNNKPVFEKNPKERLPVASLTKLMTAMVAIDNKRSDDRYVVRPQSLVGENSIGLSAGEIMSLEELLYGVFMYSANDAAEVLADETLGRAEFVKTMNNKAKALGLTDTNFTNPTGLEGDGNQYSTATDLLVMSKYAIENYPQIRKAASTAEYYFPATADHYEYYLYSQLNLLTTYPGVKGLKDGYTPEAGWCLITYYKKGDQELIAIILGSENRRDEMRSLLDYSLIKLGITPPPKYNLSG